MLMQIDGTFIFVVISFLVFLFIIKTILYHPITKVIDERDNFYTKNSKMESESKLKSKNLLDEKENTLKQARHKAGELIKNVTSEAKNKSEEKIKEVKQNLLNETELNKTNLENESIEAKKEIKGEMNNIVKQIIHKVLNQDVDIHLEDENISKYLKING